ncbi:MAG: DUF4340 domain-containing protein [Spirochaetaceae bacterium]|jgi:hypothetical protein|nr:DUF4340 domain-containing protein [Spirochaetaceae bacterium]
MKMRKEYILASVIIVASILYLVLRSDSKVNYDIPRFSDVDKNSITEITISETGESLKLKKTDNSWTIEPQGYKADKSLVNKLLSESSTISIVDLISDREDYARFELENNSAVTVRISTSEGPVREFLLGKSSSSSVYSYIRLPGQKGVYSVRGNLKNTFKSSMDEWRDKQVLSFDPEAVIAIEITKDKNTVLLSRIPVTESTPQWSKHGEVLENSDEIQNQAKTFSILKCSAYLEETSGDPLASLKIKTADGEQTLSLYEKLDNGYSARSTYVNDPFLLPLYLSNMILEL